MNRSTLRFLGFQHDRLAAAGGSQVERDRLLAKIDALADAGRDIRPRVGARATIKRKTPRGEFTFDATITSVTPADGFVFVSWEGDAGRFGNLEHGKANAYGDRLVACAS